MFREHIQNRRETAKRTYSEGDDLEGSDEVDLLMHLEMISAARSQRHATSLARVLEYTEALDKSGFYACCGSNVDREQLLPAESVSQLDSERQTLETTWHSEYNTWCKQWKKHLVPEDSTSHPSDSNNDDSWMSSNLHDQSTLANKPLSPRIRDSIFDPIVMDVNILEHAKQWNLNKEQTHAFRIIAEHSTKLLVDALRMYIGGAGSTGKSRVIQALTNYFARTGQQC